MSKLSDPNADPMVLIIIAVLARIMRRFDRYAVNTTRSA